MRTQTPLTPLLSSLRLAGQLLLPHHSHSRTGHYPVQGEPRFRGAFCCSSCCCSLLLISAVVHCSGGMGTHPWRRSKILCRPSTILIPYHTLYGINQRSVLDLDRSDPGVLSTKRSTSIQTQQLVQWKENMPSAVPDDGRIEP